MNKIVIKKRISLDFLGEEYNDSYITLKSIPVAEYDSLIDDAKKAQEPKDNIKFITNTNKRLFIEGKVFDGSNTVDIIKDDLDSLDIDTHTNLFEIISGQKQNPKV